MARFLAGENFPAPVIEELRRLGHDVLTLREAGRAGESLPDTAVLDLAAVDSRAVLTLNRKHFIRLNESDVSHSGIAVCTLDLDFPGQAARIHAQVASHTDLAGRLVRVNRPPT